MAWTTFVDGTTAVAGEVNANFEIVKGTGDGSDGAFSESSGDTALTGGTIYQYTSFSLTGTATISYTGTTQKPVIILIQGDCTISTSGTCDFNGKVTTTPTLTTTTMLDVDEYIMTITTNTDGEDGNSSDSGGFPTIAGNPPTYQDIIREGTCSQLSNCPMYIQGGTQGGTGDVGGSGTTGGPGGAGGAALMIIAGGDTAISNVTFDMEGADGGNGTFGVNPSIAHGGGGGGSGVIAIFSYGTLTDSGTYSTAASAGGSGAENGSWSATSMSSGSGGASMVERGARGNYSGNSAQTGGGGGAGFSVRKKLL
jgi:hypothetical protein